jgi:hypothetical protein
VAAPKEILDLVARFEQPLGSYKSGNYIFKALGSDIDNNAGYPQ